MATRSLVLIKFWEEMVYITNSVCPVEDVAVILMSPPTIVLLMGTFTVNNAMNQSLESEEEQVQFQKLLFLKDIQQMRMTQPCVFAAQSKFFLLKRWCHQLDCFTKVALDV